jgi:hypothetical protein
MRIELAQDRVQCRVFGFSSVEPRVSITPVISELVSCSVHHPPDWSVSHVATPEIKLWALVFMLLLVACIFSRMNWLGIDVQISWPLKVLPVIQVPRVIFNSRLKHIPPYWLTDRQSQSDFDFDFDIPCIPHHSLSNIASIFIERSGS